MILLDKPNRLDNKICQEHEKNVRVVSLNPTWGLFFFLFNSELFGGPRHVLKRKYDDISKGKYDDQNDHNTFDTRFSFIH